MVTNQQNNVNKNPTNAKIGLNFPPSVNSGIIIEPKNNKPRLENISAIPSI